MAPTEPMVMAAICSPLRSLLGVVETASVLAGVDVPLGKLFVLLGSPVAIAAAGLVDEGEFNEMELAVVAGPELDDVLLSPAKRVKEMVG